jgi:DNA-binding GntR family transcriptional regulator
LDRVKHKMAKAGCGPAPTLRSALQSELVDRIKELIRSNGPAARGRVREATLSRAMGVSRTPVRAALQYLIVTGVLAIHPRGGYVVTRMPSPTTGSFGGDGGPAKLYGRLLHDILMNEAPDAASESALMRHYGVGRGEILQVLRRLVREGLAEPLPGRGWTLLSITGEQLTRSYHLRSILEPAMLAERAYQVDHDALTQLRAGHEFALDSLSADSPWQELFELDAKFHEALARGTGNEMIVDVVRRQNRLRRLAEFVSYGRLERVRQSIQEHLAIIDALLGGDRDCAAALMRRHLAVSRRETEEHFDRDREALGTNAGGLNRVVRRRSTDPVRRTRSRR